ncbi:AraC family transcriptional regulator [Amycolatopsis acidiphila]|uniref:helix-turn-helix transcriptional regulator n=1 Tax=Amycolatopsis acidiphila TaxID=715473 RepID=UPI0016437D09|nr:AraC family transcriptional regulator [Amycolatopsis acidiphila]UIJ57563.1 AraC family transcriptional regulator [Amycolatopsis acidiphila]GHG89510.1 hypothetical protein GCM10017788_64300 [Amycolatopsis acidiphila]
MHRGRTTLATTDVGHAEETLTELYLPLRLLPLRPRTTLDVGLDVVALGSVTIGHLGFGSDIRILTAEVLNYHVDIPVAGRSRSRSGSRDEVFSDPGTAAVFMPAAPADLSWTDGARQICVMLDATEVEHELSTLLGQHLREPLSFANKMDLSGPGGRAWVHALELVAHHAWHETGLLSHRLAVRRLEQVILDGLLTAQPHNYSEQLREDRRSPGLAAVRQAIELTEERPDHPWTPGELAAAVSVSARTLSSGFRKETGMTPLSYLKAVRLHRVHRELIAADRADTTVTEVARRWGFVHLGRFAADYRRRYLESPSETLRSAARRPS